MLRSRPTFTQAAHLAPPHAWFAVSAVFHYLGPSFAVLLFPSVGVLGVAWMRIAAAAAIFAPWTAPWRTFARADRQTRRLLIGLGVCLAVMNSAFYLALDRLPMSLVASIEFVGTIGVALYGLRTARNLAALALAVLGVFLLINVRWSSDPIGLFWAFLNGALFVGYIVLGHKAAEAGASGGVGLLGAAMAIAFLFIMPIGFREASRAFAKPDAGARRDRRRHLLVCDPVCLRSARDVPAAARQFRLDAGAAAGDCDRGRDHRAQADSEPQGHARRADGDGGGRDPPARRPTGRAAAAREYAACGGILPRSVMTAGARLMSADRGGSVLDMDGEDRQFNEAALDERLDRQLGPRKSGSWPCCERSLKPAKSPKRS